MRIGPRRDDHPVDAGSEQRLQGVDALDTVRLVAIDDPLRLLGDEIGHHQ